MKINEKYTITILIVILQLLLALVLVDSAWHDTNDQLRRDEGSVR